MGRLAEARCFLQGSSASGFPDLELECSLRALMWESRGRTAARGERSPEVTRTAAVQGFIDGSQQLGLQPQQIGTAGALLCLLPGLFHGANPSQPTGAGLGTAGAPEWSLKLDPHPETARWGPKWYLE